MTQTQQEFQNKWMHYCQCVSLQDATAFIQLKLNDGWKVMVPPFVSKQDMFEIAEDVWFPVPKEWTFVIYKL